MTGEFEVKEDALQKHRLKSIQRVLKNKRMNKKDSWRVYRVSCVTINKVSTRGLQPPFLMLLVYK